MTPATRHSGFHIRHAVLSDAVPLCNILNAIIEAGGTTALETPFSITEFSDHLLLGDEVLACFVAEDLLTHQVLGFQGLGRNSDLQKNWSDIWTFIQREPKLQGAGTALFGQTRAWANELKLTAINATIRADNQGGLVYYEKMGFKTYKHVKGVPLKDGTPIDRIFKYYLLR
jgi:RimJ/RimL family protein N-acetyltransferase